MVQVYASLPDATVPAPRVRLVAFQRVRAIAAGASVAVTLTVTPDTHAVVLDGAQNIHTCRFRAVSFEKRTDRPFPETSSGRKGSTQNLT